jgi:hypothetical protein
MTNIFDYGNVSMKDYEMLHQLYGLFPGSSFSPGLALTIGVMDLIGLVVATKHMETALRW